MAEQFDKLIKRNAFMEQYKKEQMFRESNQEFEDSRETVKELIDEYGEAEKEQYLDWDNGGMR